MAKYIASIRGLMRTLGGTSLLSQVEIEDFEKQLQQAVGKQRSMDLFVAGASLSRKLRNVIARNSQQLREMGESKRAGELEVLFEIGRVIQVTLEPGKAFELLLKLVNKAIPYENGTLFLFDRDAMSLQPVAVRGHQVDLLSEVRFDLGQGFSGWVAKQKRPVLLSGLKRPGVKGEPVIRSFLSVPLVIQQELIGVINLAHSKANAFDRDDLRLLTLIAGQAAAIIERVLSFNMMEKLSITDELTSLHNRRHFCERLQNEVEKSQRYHHPFSILFMDIDYFKKVNDLHGHKAGDSVLREFGKLLRECARGSDLVARYGGEEFVMLLPYAGYEEAATAAERIRKRIQKHVFPKRRTLTVSVGISTFPEDGETVDELLSRADAALYAAKQAGRNTVMGRAPEVLSASA